MTDFENTSEVSGLLLTPEEARVLGCLMEKQVTTPDAYPLTFNSLLLACNQKTNRSPVVNYDEEILAEAIEGLREKRLALRVDGAGSRVPKYRHSVDDQLGLIRGGKALLTVLLLRGPQTAGELRTRSERMHAFSTPASVEEELADLQGDSDLPLWCKLPQAPGQKEARYQHLLSGPVETSDLTEIEASEGTENSNAALDAVKARNDRIVQLEGRVEALELELQKLAEVFADFQKQFE